MTQFKETHTRARAVSQQTTPRNDARAKGTATASTPYLAQTGPAVAFLPLPVRRRTCTTDQIHQSMFYEDDPNLEGSLSS